MKPSGVAITPSCEECGEVWLPADDRRWQAHRIDDEPDCAPELGLWCPECGSRKLGRTMG